MEESKVLEPEDSAQEPEDTVKHHKIGFNWQDLKIGIALGCGATQEAAAKFAGCTRVTVQNRLKHNKHFVNQVSDLASACVASRLNDLHIENKEQLQRELSKLRGKALRAYDKALEADDIRVNLQAAEAVVDRLDGKATQRMETAGVVEHRIVALPNSVVQQLIGAVQGTQKLLNGDVIEGEVVE